MKHIEDTYLNQTVEYFVSGSANLNDNSNAHAQAIPPNSLKYFHGLPEENLISGGLTVVQANLNNMTITFFDTTGKELYQKVIYPRSF